MSDQLMELSDENFIALMDKLAEEVAELQVAKSQGGGKQLEQELESAILQSRELMEELRQVHVMVLDARKDGRRKFTSDEATALEYFGFRVPADGRPPPAATSTQLKTAAATSKDVFVSEILPQPRRSLSMAASEAPETETDVADILRLPSATYFSGAGGGGQQYRQHVVHGHRTHTPKVSNGPSNRMGSTAAASIGTAAGFYVADEPTFGLLDDDTQHHTQNRSISRRSLSMDFTTQLPAATAAQSRRSTSTSSVPEPPLVPSTEASGPKTSSSHPQQHPFPREPSTTHEAFPEAEIEALMRAHAEELEALRRDSDARVAQAEQEKEALTAEVSQLDARYRQQLVAAESKFREEFESLLASADDLAATLDKTTREKEEACASQARRAEVAEAQLAALRAKSEALEQRHNRDGAALESKRQELVGLVRTSLIPELTSLLDAFCLLQQKDAVRRQHDVQQRTALSHLMSSRCGFSEASSYEDVEKAFQTLQSTEAARAVTYSLGSCSDAEPVDLAVTDLLNSLGFPFVVPIRRLGRGGDYFIDRRLHVRLVGGQVMVRTRVAPATGGLAAGSAPSTTPFEHLAKYLVHLYAPLLVADEKRQPSVPPPHGGTGDARQTSSIQQLAQSGEEGHVLRLQEQQQHLQKSLAVQQELLRQHHRDLLSELSPSPDHGDKRRQDVAKNAPPKAAVGKAAVVGGWRRPPSPSPEVQRPASISPEVTRAPLSVNSALQERQREMLIGAGVVLATTASKENDNPIAVKQQQQKKIPKVKHGSGSIDAIDLSQLTAEELERLKRAALAQQVREMKQYKKSSF